MSSTSDEPEREEVDPLTDKKPPPAKPSKKPPPKVRPDGTQIVKKGGKKAGEKRG